ncbi:MAG TPA: hypothetical protein PK362_10140 [Elusimicrobiota bacterium]|nr:hypothetical protein [Elusimicrobiota bacterium]
MNGAQWHLALIHFPVAGVFFALLLLTYAFFRKNGDVLKVALGFLVVTGGAGLAAYWTGEGAEEVLEQATSVAGGWVHTHEEAAEAALIALEIAAALALGGLVFFRRSGGPRPAYVGAVIGATILAAGLLGRAAHHGGQIRHTEVRPPSAADAPASKESPDDHAH